MVYRRLFAQSLNVYWDLRTFNWWIGTQQIAGNCLTARRYVWSTLDLIIVFIIIFSSFLWNLKSNQCAAVAGFRFAAEKIVYRFAMAFIPAGACHFASPWPSFFFIRADLKGVQVARFSPFRYLADSAYTSGVTLTVLFGWSPNRRFRPLNRRLATQAHHQLN